MFTISIKDIYTYRNLTNALIVCLENVYWKPSVQRASMTCLELLYKDYTSVNEEGVLPDLNVQSPMYLKERGKKRKITPIAFNNRILQRCICDNALMPAFKSSLIYANTASLPKKGVAYTRKLLRRYMTEAYRKWGSDFYIITADIKSYFDSVRHDVCENILKSKIQDKRIINFCMEFIRSGIDNDDGVGIALGSQVSQLMALFVLSCVDHTAKDKMQTKYYIRYMDDMCAFVHTKDEALVLMNELKQSAEKVGLHFNTNKTMIVHATRGAPFLKFRYRYTKTGKIIDTPVRSGKIRNLKRLNKLAKKVKAGEKTIEEIDNSMNSWLAHNNEGYGYRANRSLLQCYYRCFGVPYGGKQCTT